MFPDGAFEHAKTTAHTEQVTLFAPNNQALQAVESVLGASGGSNNMLVNNLLAYHVLQGVYMADNITATPQFPHTTLNSTMYTNVTGGQVVECRLVNNMTAQIISGLKAVANVTQAVRLPTIRAASDRSN